ncbi:MFS transporter [Fischerella sp. PCC 9605]|uniref:MFS transporter n=1 Tax=Fischerella sp. PCC 9605 TaxID=1173024 RepID=UPI00047A66BD|nr:MFS transporter [Fischerella sp. PCC 9605]
MRQEQQSFLEKWSSPASLCLTQFLVAYNVSVVPAIMPRIVRDLDSSVGSIQGALVLLPLVKASFAPTCENLIKRFSRKSVFMAGLGLFTIGAIATSVSSNMGFFIVAYSLITGLGATPLIGSPRDLIGRIYQEKAEKYALLALIVSSIIGGLTGALLGGWIASRYGWRWSFLPAILLVPVIFILLRSIPRTRQTYTVPLDWIGGLLSFLGFGLTLVGVSLAGEYGWWAPKQPFKIFGIVIPPFALSIVPTLIAAGIVCLGMFVAWQRRQARQGKASLLRAGLLRHKPFLLGLFTATLHYMITTGMQFNLYQFLPVVLRLNPYQTALAVLPFSLATLVVVVYTTFKIVGRVPSQLLIYAGLTIFCVGVWQLYNAISLSMTTLNLLPALVIMGAGSGLFLAQIGITTFSTVTRDNIAEASGIYDPFQDLGRALGRAILGTVLIGTASIKIVDQAIAQLGQTVSPEQRQKAIATLERVVQTYSREERKEFINNLPTVIQPSLDTILNTSAVEAMRTAVLLGLVFSLACLFLAFFLPKQSSRRTD